MDRARAFIKRLLITLIIITFLAAVVIALQLATGMLDPYIKALETDLRHVDAALSRQLVTGLSAGTLVLVLFILFFPLLMKGVDKKLYIVSIQRGIISSFVFMLSYWLYGLMEKISHAYLFLSVAAVVVVTILIVEFITLAIPEDREKAFRTDILAAVVSGLVSGILVKMALVGLEMLKIKLF